MTRFPCLLLAAALATSCGAPSAPGSSAQPPPSASGARDPAGDPDAPAPSAEGGQGRAPTAEERAIIDKLSAATERLRDLTFKEPVPVEIQDEVRISAQLSALIEEEDLVEARVIYSALGLLAPEADLRTLIERLASEQVVGYFDPKEGRLVVRDDVMDERGGPTGDAGAVLVHELVHGLQHQHLELGERYDRERDTDPANAFDAVVEGDATLAMLGHLLGRQGAPLELITRQPALLAQTMEQAPLHGMELESAPAIVRVTLVAPYIHGLLFAATLHGRGGWKAVDRAHGKPPRSTEQVLHPAKYLANEEPEPVTVPALPELEAAGFEPAEEDTLGELELRVYFAQHRPEVDQDEKAAAGWAGDRLRVYRRGDDPGAVVWLTAWDDEDEAREAQAAARAVRRAVPADRRSQHRVERDGRALLIVRNLPADLHPPVQKAFRSFAGSL